MLRACRPGKTAAAVRREQVSDAQWQRCAFWTDYFDPLGWDDMMVALSMQPAGFRLYNFSRLKSERSFASRSAPSRLAPMGGASLTDLPPREREVLVALADGDNEKQIAVRLVITRNTVHEYVRRLFARFGVSSRGQLLARAARQLHAIRSAAAIAEPC